MKKILLAVVAFIACAALPVAAQLWGNFPIMGGASYCDSTVNGACVSTIPAGPTWTGLETVPADTNAVGGQYASGIQTVKVPVSAFGIGGLLVVTSPATATIPVHTPFYILSGTQGSAYTITMVPSPADGHIQRVICDKATAGALTVAANTTVVAQVLDNNPNTACVAGVSNQASLTWFRIQ